MKVTKITIGRLFNLGNYEHVRYDLTVEVPEGQSAIQAIHGLENILDGLNPKPPVGVPSPQEIMRAEAMIAFVEKQSEGEVNREHHCSKAVHLHALQKELKNKIEKRDKWEAVRRQSRAFFDDVGGAAIYTDAKHNWTDDDTEF